MDDYPEQREGNPRPADSDAPSPPGGSLREDDAAAVDPRDAGAGRQAPDSVEDRHGGTIAVEDEHAGSASARPPEEDGEDPAERENAETSQEQPSDG